MNWPWPDGARAPSIAILVVVALLLGLPFFLNGLDDERLEVARGDPFEQADAILPRRLDGGPEAPSIAPPVESSRPIEALLPVDAATSRVFSGLVTEIDQVLKDLKSLKARPENEEDRLARRLRREQEQGLGMERLRLDQAIVTAMRRDPALGLELFARMDGDGPEDVSLHLARLLRQVESSALGASLLDRLNDGENPGQRVLALVALEGPRSPLTAELAVALMQDDADPAIRDQAAEFLGRALIDPLRRDEQARILGEISAGLRSEKAELRLRSLRALRYLRHPEARTIEAVDPLRQDADAAVRDEARLLWRFWRLEVG